MTQKDFIVQLQKSCHLENQQCTMLLNALSKLMAKAGVEQVSVTLPGLGTFTSHKHPEYIKENSETGQQTLFPPRITYRMQSVDENVPQDLLEKLMVESVKTPVDEIHKFLGALVQTILSCLKRGEEVDVKGIGNFRIINSNQGEIQRIAYTPDEQMKQQVNAPFNCFEPVVIHSGVDPVSPEVEEKEIDPQEPPIVASPVHENTAKKSDISSGNSADSNPNPEPAEEPEDSPKSEAEKVQDKPQEPKVEIAPDSADIPVKEEKRKSQIAKDRNISDEELLKEIQRNNRLLFLILISLIVISLGALCKFLFFPSEDKAAPEIEAVDPMSGDDATPREEIIIDQKDTTAIDSVANSATVDSIALKALRAQQYRKWLQKLKADSIKNAASADSALTDSTTSIKTTVASDTSAVSKEENATVTVDSARSETNQSNQPLDSVTADKDTSVTPGVTDSTLKANSEVQPSTAKTLSKPDTINTVKEKTDTLTTKAEVSEH